MGTVLKILVSIVLAAIIALVATAFIAPKWMRKKVKALLTIAAEDATEATIKGSGRGLKKADKEFKENVATTADAMVDGMYKAHTPQVSEVRNAKITGITTPDGETYTS